MEPTYEYIKGKGWVVATGVIATMQCGTVVRLEPRMPGIGETWLRAQSWLKPDGTPDMDEFKYCAERYYSSYQELHDDRCVTETSLIEIQGYEPAAWVTVVPL